MHGHGGAEWDLGEEELALVLLLVLVELGCDFVESFLQLL